MQYQDAMAIVRAYGKPDFFITFRCTFFFGEGGGGEG